MEKDPRDFPYVTLDEWIVMPDHVHGILVLQNRPSQDQNPQRSRWLLARSLGAVIGQFKSKATKRIRKDLGRPSFDWQERFHDSIVRSGARAALGSREEEWLCLIF